jgi:soluble lytic murein transglycosylase-like protein
MPGRKRIAGPLGSGIRVIAATAIAAALALQLAAGLMVPPAEAAKTFSNMRPDDVDPALRAKLIRAIIEADSFADRFDAEVWLTDMSSRLKRQVPDADERLRILMIVHQQASRAGLPPELVLAVIDVESNFDRYAISSASALGLMQVMPFWIDELGYKNQNELFDIHKNVLIGCQILKHYLDMEDGDLIRGLARYNGSRGQRWYGDRVVERLRTRWFRI